MIALVVIVVLLAVAAAVAIGAVIVTRRRLEAQRAVTAAAEARVAEREAELAGANAALADATRGQAVAGEERALATERAALADERAIASAAGAAEAAARAAAAELRVADLAAAVGHDETSPDEAPDQVDHSPTESMDPRVLWRLEQSRSERTWRNSVAVDPDAGPSLADAAEPLREALQIELDAAREEVGVDVELEADLPGGISAGGSVLALRAAQELLADIVRRAERATLDVRADGRDLLVTVSGTDADDAAVSPQPLPLPASPVVVAIDGGVRIRDAIDPPA